MNPRKRGQIKAYSKDCHAGVIVCEDGSNYRLRREDLKGGVEPADHENVQFDEDRKDARNVEYEIIIKGDQ